MIWYTVYRHETDEFLACGAAIDCARALGLSLASFYSSVSRSATGKQRKYDFVKEEVDEEDLK